MRAMDAKMKKLSNFKFSVLLNRDCLDKEGLNKTYFLNLESLWFEVESIDFAQEFVSFRSPSLIEVDFDSIESFMIELK